MFLSHLIWRQLSIFGERASAGSLQRQSPVYVVGSRYVLTCLLYHTQNSLRRLLLLRADKV